MIFGERQIDDFLFYGYLPVPEVEFLSEIVTSKLSGTNSFDYSVPRPELLRQGARALSSAFECEPHSPGLQVVPLSGGFDSRAILGELLDRGLRNELVTVTFGTPGTWDFDIGRLVASAAGVRGESVDLTKQVERWTTEDLVATARTLSRPVWIFDKHVNRSLTNVFGTGATYWSGFMGDPIAGSHLGEKPSPTWNDALRRFAEKNRFVRVSLNSAGYEPVDTLPAAPLLTDATLLELDEQADLAIRQGGYVREIVIQADRAFRRPFLASAWVGFLLNAPRQMRYRQVLYRDVLQYKYPALFALPSKNLRGSALSTSHFRRILESAALDVKAFSHRVIGSDYLKRMSTNYIDFDAAIRRVAGFQDLVRSNLVDLQARNLAGWLDIQRLLRSHLSGSANLGRELTLLTSLEIFLKSR